MSAPRFSDVHETDAQQVEALLAPALRPDHRPSEGFTLHVHRVTRGPVSVEETRGTDGVRIALEGEPSYVVGLPVGQPVHAVHRRRDLDLIPGQAAVLAPPVEATIGTPDQFDVVLVRVGPVALEDMLESLLGRAVRRPLLPLPTTVALGTTGGEAWARAVRSVAGAVPGAGSSLGNPLGAEELQHALLVGLLYATAHPDRDALDVPVLTWGPRKVRECLDLIEAHPERPLTSGTLAAHAGMSVRAFDGCWRRDRDVLPRQDVERVRLRRAHRDLEAHRPGETTVAAVAAAWGFPPREFGAVYRARFGRSPAQTLRGPAYA
jgi:AraC-like DNA-binding protein